LFLGYSLLIAIFAEQADPFGLFAPLAVA